MKTALMITIILACWAVASDGHRDALRTQQAGAPIAEANPHWFRPVGACLQANTCPTLEGQP